MGNLLIINAKGLVQATEEPQLRSGSQMEELPIIENGYLYISQGVISNYGAMENLPTVLEKDAQIIDATDKYVFPSFCDSHTHLVYAGSREQEFVDKIKGLSYVEIAKRGGGILNSAKLLHQTPEDELFCSAMERIEEITQTGTGAVEIKSGYGLNSLDEIKMLRVIKRLSRESDLEIKATFLGAHAVPQTEDKAQYVDEIINIMIPTIAVEELADYIDVFCEDGFFSVEDTDRILNAGMKYGLEAKVHANQMGFSGGVQVGVKYDAVSVDHLESIGEAEIEALKSSSTIATLLPGATFFLNMDYAPARKLIDSNIPIAIATNYNPGSCPSGNIQFEMALACLKMRMTPNEVINAVTINGAYAMGVEDSVGSITKGKKANLFITKKIPSIDFIPYAFTTPFIDKIILNGKIK